VRLNFNIARRLLMRLDEKARTTLVKRELELRRLLRQMELDKLSSSTVFKNLQNELNVVKEQLIAK